MNYSKIFKESIVDGDGVRVSLFVSGCRNHCPGCFNRETWDFKFGKEFTSSELSEITQALNPSYIDGLTILGGEPFEEENQPEILEIIKKVKDSYPDKTVWIFTGYVVDRDLLMGQRKNIAGVTEEILKRVDVIIDGPFIQAERDLSLQFRGSRNQRMLSKIEILKMIERGRKA